MLSYILEKGKNSYHAGFKAREDIQNILLTYKITSLNCNKASTNKYFFYLLEIINKFPKIKNTFFFQYPNYGYIYILSKLLKKIKGIKSICIIHDIDGIRFQNTKFLKKEIKRLRNVDYIISHNSKMTTKLIELGINKNTIYNLEVFDYLLNNQKFSKEKKESDICFAGNLMKSKFIYNFDDKFKKIKIDIYGINFEENKSNKYISFKGAYHPNIIHEKLTGKYGLIWDGDSIEKCNGSNGEYMKYNNPHKLSLYIAAGIPIITWKEAAIAEFIEKNNIGITVGSLYELEEYFRTLDDIDYQEQVKNVLKIRESVINGEMFKKVFGEISEKLKK